MFANVARSLTSRIVTFREGEAVTGILMFVYSFLVMTAYNAVKPAAASNFIENVGSDKVPYVFLVAGVSMGFVMNYYSRLVGKVPKRWVLPGTQLILVTLLTGFWFLLQTGQAWVSAAFFTFGRFFLGIFLISQFWTLANDIYDPRQAKRLFGFIGGGAFLGGMMGSGLTALLAARVGTVNLVLLSAGVLVVCFFLILVIQSRSQLDEGSFEAKETLGGGEAIAMLRKSRHLQLIALLIGFAAMGATVLEQQLYGASDTEIQGQDSITSFLAGITFIISGLGFFVQVYLTSRIYSLLGIGFALAVLPATLGTTAFVILLNPVLWASSLGRVADSVLRYSLDKTTRETLFLPLPADLKLKAKAFVDVTADRFIGKGIGSILLLIALNAFGATWYQLSFLSLPLCLAWLYSTRLAKREYMGVFRRSIESLELEPERLSPQVGDTATVETLVEELGSLDETRVVRSIEMLESLEKRNLITPLLLHHESAPVRSRTLLAIRSAKPELVQRWRPAVEKSLNDEDPDVRASAVEVLAVIVGDGVTGLMRPYLEDNEPRIAATAAVALAASDEAEDRNAAMETLRRLSSDAREAGVLARREAARAIARCDDPDIRQLLIPLIYDAEVTVAREAVQAARLRGDGTGGTEGDYVFVPALVSLLRDQRLRNDASEVLVSYGEGVVDTLAYFLRDEQEDAWVRRHIPATLARLPSQESIELLLESLASDDGFLRFKAISALDRLRAEHPDLAIGRESVEKLTVQDLKRFYRYLGLGFALFDRGGLSKDSLLAQSLSEKRNRAMERVYLLLGLVNDRKDIRAARWTIQKGDHRSRASAIEFLDNTLRGDIRKMILPILDDGPLEEKARKGNSFLKTRFKGMEETLARLVYDEDQVIAATAIDLVRELKVWELADDLEQVLQFRDASDFAVFEAASYALAAYRGKEAELHAV